MTISVGSGECYGLLWPNGAGKSTTVGMLGTLVRPTSGRAMVAGFDVVAEPREVRRRIGFAMQDAGVDAFATARELLVLQGRLHGLQRADAVKRARLLLAMVDLAEVADKRLGGFSGGMQRRVDLAAALVHLPAVVFLDEPTEGLDPRARATIWDALERLREHLGVTVVLTTHSMEADRLCDRLGIFDRGRVVIEGTPARSTRSRSAPQELVDVAALDQQPQQIESPVMRAIVDANPAEHVLRPMRELMLSGYNWADLGLALAVILALGLIGVPLTVRNYRSVYR